MLTIIFIISTALLFTTLRFHAENVELQRSCDLVEARERKAAYAVAQAIPVQVRRVMGAD